MSSISSTRNGQAGKATRGAFFGFFVDMFDIYLPVVVLAPALIYFVSPDLPAGTKAIIASLIFVSSLLGRPLGALIFGHFADTVGRKRTTVIAVGGIGVLTIAIGCLPGYETWGITSVALFLVLRFTVGIFVGGEYTGASPLAMEATPRSKRGLYGALIMTGFPLAFVSISLLTLLMLQVAPAGNIDSAYVQWGWRIPFFIGGILAVAFVIYFVRNVDESEVFVKSGRAKAPILQLFRGQSLRDFLQVFILMTGFWLSLFTVSAILPGLLQGKLELSPTNSSWVLILAFLLVPFGQITAGVWSQRVGRRPFLIWWGVLAAVSATPLYAILIGAELTFLGVVLLSAALVMIVVSGWGLVTTYVNERFQTGVRSTGFGLGYSLAVVIPSFYAVYQAGLAHIMPAEYTALPLLVIGCLAVTVGALLGPETRDVEFHDEPN